MSNIRRSRADRNLAQGGFTLVEVLLALAITAVIAVIAYQALSSASEGAQKTREVIEDINRLDRTWQIIAVDLHQALAPRPTPNGTRFEFIGSSLRSTGENAEQTVLVFARDGWVNPLQRLRSDVQRVHYRVSEGTLWRDYVPELNIPPEEIDFEYEAFHQLMIEGIKDIQLRFLSADILQSRGRGVFEGFKYSDSWAPEWPVAQAGQAGLPIAVEITIDVEGIGASVRLFELAQPSQ